MAGYLIIVMPFEKTMTNFQQIMNECLTGMAFALSFIFTYDLSTSDQMLYCKILCFNFL